MSTTYVHVILLSNSSSMSNATLPPGTRLRRCRFTINNPNDNDSEAILNTDGWSLLVVGMEIGEKCGTPHYQGYGELAAGKQLSVKQLCAKLGGRAAILACNASRESNYAYATKDLDIIIEWGAPRAQGKRNDIALARDMVQSGTMRDVIVNIDSYQAWRAAQVCVPILEPQRKEKPFVVWLYGSSGLGKSKTAELTFPDAYWHPGDKWWDGYDRHESVIIDDIRKDTFPFSFLLRLLDRYPLRVEVKHGYRQMVATSILITSPVHPAEMFRNNGEEIRQLMRRIDMCERVGDPPIAPGLPALPSSQPNALGYSDSEVQCNIGNPNRFPAQHAELNWTSISEALDELLDVD